MSGAEMLPIDGWRLFGWSVSEAEGRGGTGTMRGVVVFSPRREEEGKLARTRKRRSHSFFVRQKSAYYFFFRVAACLRWRTLMLILVGSVKGGRVEGGGGRGRGASWKAGGLVGGAGVARRHRNISVVDPPRRGPWREWCVDIFPSLRFVGGASADPESGEWD